jgi:hypothetical protein
MGSPTSAGEIPYIRDFVNSVDNNPAAVLSPRPTDLWDWTLATLDGVEQILALSPVAMQASGTVLAWTAPTARVVVMDRFVTEGQPTPFATVRQHGLGYAVAIAAKVSDDAIVAQNPDNIRWICNLASVLHGRVQEEARIRDSQPGVLPPSRLSPYGDRSTAELVVELEDLYLEHKQTLLYDMRTKVANPDLEREVINRICSFWNTGGGTLLIGVEDRTGRVTGLRPDLKLVKDEDDLVNRLSQKLKNQLRSIAPFVWIRSEPVGDQQVLRIDVPKGDYEVFNGDQCFVRINNSTQELKGRDLQDYLRSRFSRA